MPLAKVNDLMTSPTPQDPPLGEALLDHPPVTGDNAVYKAKKGNAVWLGNKFVVSGQGLCNYWYIPAVQDKVSYCVVHGNGQGEAYVVSDQFGGCEYHQLYNEEWNMVAFLHVYRTGGKPAGYTPADGWVVQSKKYSNKLAQSVGMTGSIWAFSCIDRSEKRLKEQSQFIAVKGFPNLTVSDVDTGDLTSKP